MTAAAGPLPLLSLARTALGNVTAAIGDVPVAVIYATAHGGTPGLDQVNIGPLPPALMGRGEATLQIKVDGRLSNILTVRLGGE